VHVVPRAVSSVRHARLDDTRLNTYGSRLSMVGLLRSVGTTSLSRGRELWRDLMRSTFGHAEMPNGLHIRSIPLQIWHEGSQPRTTSQEGTSGVHDGLLGSSRDARNDLEALQDDFFHSNC
jgi:hypothetical protein